MDKPKLLYVERHGDQYLIKLNRDDGRTVAGITAMGDVVTVPDATTDLTDDEWLELLSINKDNISGYN